MSHRKTGSAKWEAFLGLLPLLSQQAVTPAIRSRLSAAICRLTGETVGRDALLLQSGLSFFDDSLEVDIALMQLIREGVLTPFSEKPFTFCVVPPKGAALCVPSRSKPDAAFG